MNLYDVVAGYISETRAKLQTAKSDGKITASEAFELFTDAVSRLVTGASQLPVSGAEKKAMVLDAAGQMFDLLIAPIDIPYIPEFAEKTIVDPALRKLTIEATSGMIEFFVKRLPASGTAA